MKLLLLVKKIMGYEEIFTIAYRNIKGGEACFIDNKPIKFRIWEDIKDYWYADPILFTKDNTDYLFVEMFDRKKYRGAIGVSKFENGNFSKPQMIIEEVFHMSYPYVFEIDNDIYLLPETSEAKKLIFYKCIEFPYKWETHTEIGIGRLLVDTNVIKKNDSYYLLSALLEDDLFRTRMHFVKLVFESRKFSLGLDENFQYDSTASLETRSAGRWFEINGKTLRPSQVSKDGLYGYSLKFFETNMDNNSYEEKCLYELNPEQIHFQYKGKEIKAIGTHTYARAKTMEIIDVKMLVFNKVKWIRRIINNIYNK